MPTYTTRILVSLLAGATVAATAIATRSQAASAPGAPFAEARTTDAIVAIARVAPIGRL